MSEENNPPMPTVAAEHGRLAQLRCLFEVDAQLAALKRDGRAKRNIYKVSVF